MVENSTAAGYTAPQAQPIRAYISLDSTSNNTKQEQPAMTDGTIWDKDSIFLSTVDLCKKLGIPTHGVTESEPKLMPALKSVVPKLSTTSVGIWI